MTRDNATPATSELWTLVQEQGVQIAELKQKAAKVDQLEAELERHRIEKVALVSRLVEVEGGHSAGERKLSRAGLFKAAASGAAGLAVGTALQGPQSAFAGTDGDVVLSSTSNTGTSETAVHAGAAFPSPALLRVDASTNGNTGNIDAIQAQGSGTFSGVAGWGGAGGGRGVTGFGTGTQGPGVVGVGAGRQNPSDPQGAIGVMGFGMDGNFGVYGECADGYGVFGIGGQNVLGAALGSGYGGVFGGATAQLELTPNLGAFPRNLPAGQAYSRGDIWLGYGSVTNVVSWLCTSEGASQGSPGTWVPFMHGNSNDGANDTLFTAVSTRQYTLSDSNGVSWIDMDDTNLSLTLTPQQNSLAIISANSDLWTSKAGYNQDLGIAITGGSYPSTAGQPEAWKESGGFAGTFSPNAAFAQTLLPLTAGTAYTVKLQWKTNKNAPGASIWAGAGPVGGKFSPTRLTVLLVPTP
jgi:hypothetical protein